MLAAVGVALGSEIILHRTASTGDVYLALVVVVYVTVIEPFSCGKRFYQSASAECRSPG